LPSFRRARAPARPPRRLGSDRSRRAADGYRASVVATRLDLNATRSAQEARCEVGRVDPESGAWTYASSAWPAPCPAAADAPGAIAAVFLQA
jgi:hypothetical protein